MRALVCEGFGAEPRVRDLPVPEPRANEVLVRQAFSGVGAGDRLMLAGRPWLFRPVFKATMGRHRIPGRDVAGVVEAVGEAVRDVAVGHRVVGEAACAWAEQVRVDAAALAVVPEGVDLRQAGLLPVSAITALQGLKAGGIEDGSRVLVVGASGGVGHFAVQIAVAMGARVTGVCSAAKADSVRALGAERVLDYRQERFTDAQGVYDVVLDLAGTEPVGACVRTLAPGGTYVSSAGSNGGWLLGPLPRLLHCALRGLVDRRVVVLATAPVPDDLRQLLAMVADGRLVPSIVEEVAVAEAPAALGRARDGTSTGKTVIRFG